LNPSEPDRAMTSEPIRFNDGAGYDRFMGVWSRLAGQDFLDWIGPSQGQRWLDVGCGNGAFTQLIAEQCELRAWGGGSPCALRRRRYNASIEGGWHGAHRHDTARNKEAAKNFARQRLQCLLASARTLPAPPLDQCWQWVRAGMADAVSGSSQRSRPGLPGSTRPSCHLGGGQPGPCQPS
jgi:hypothetical protein